MNITEWHLNDVAVGRFARGEAGPVERHSIETHVVACRTCRERVNEAARTPATCAERWDRIATAIDRPRLVDRFSPDLAKATWASPALTAATIGLVAVLVLAVALASSIGSKATIVWLLSLAPVVPVGLVIVAFRPALDPAGALAEAAPVAGGRLPLVRSLVCCLIAIAASALAYAMFPLPSPLLATWLLPALAFAAIVLAASTWIDPFHAATVLAVGWWISIGTWFRTTRRLPAEAALGQLTWTDGSIQRALLITALAAAFIAWMRRDVRPSWRTA